MDQCEEIDETKEDLSGALYSSAHVIIAKDSDATRVETTTTTTTTNPSDVFTETKNPFQITEEDKERKNWRMMKSSRFQVFSSSSSPLSTPAHSRSATPGDPFSEPEDQHEGDGAVVVNGDSASSQSVDIVIDEADDASSTTTTTKPKTSKIGIPTLSRGPSWRSRLSASSAVSADSGCPSGNYLGVSPNSGAVGGTLGVADPQHHPANLSTSPALSGAGAASENGDSRENLLL